MEHGEIGQQQKAGLHHGGVLQAASKKMPRFIIKFIHPYRL